MPVPSQGYRNSPRNSPLPGRQSRSDMVCRPCLKFSLRGFLIAVAVLAICLGWIVNGARRRGLAIDAIVKAGGSVGYEEADLFLDEILNHEHIGHFWPDVKGEPVIISLNEKLNDFVGECLAKSVPIHTLYVCTPVDDQSLDHITTLNAGCELVFYEAEEVSEKALMALEQRLPGVQVSTVTVGRTTPISK